MTRSAEAKYESFKDIALEIAKGGNLLEIFSVIQYHLQKLVPHDHASLVLISPDGAKLSIPVATDMHTGQPVYLEGQDLSLEETILQRVIPSGKPLYRADIANSADLYPACRKLLSKGLRSDLLIPLNAGGRPIGSLNLSSKKPNPYTQENIQDASDVALLVALGIERCRLIGELVDSREKIEQYNVDLEAKLEARTQELLTAQKEMLQNERLVAIGRFGGFLAHELRNPLAVIKNIAYFLRLKLGGGEQKVKRHVDMLDKEVRIAEGIIHNLLNYSVSRLPSKSPSSLKQLVHEAIEEARVPDYILVNVECPSPFPVAPVDRTQIMQVLLNLVQNSVKAMSTGGDLTVTLEVEAETDPDKGRAIIHVKDTGHGIPEEILDKIWDHFFTTRSGGIGLGLPLVKLFVERHGGDISVKSKVDEGTTFTIRLPLKDAGATPDEPGNGELPAPAPPEVEG